MSNDPMNSDIEAVTISPPRPLIPPVPLPPLPNVKKGELAIKFPNSNYWLPLDEATMRRVHRQPPGSLSEEFSNRLQQHQQRTSDFLLKALQVPNLALFAGSGTSLGEPKGPSMWDLWVKCMFRDEADSGIDTADEQISESAKNICEVVRYSNLENPNIEHFLSTCDSYLSVFPENSQVRTFLNNCKAKILEACADFLMREDSDISAYTEMLRKLARRRTRDPRLKVFTTNYDMCFETASSELGMMVVDGFSYTRQRQFNGQYFNFDVVNRNSEELSYIQGVVHLYKLHGSVSWEFRDNNVYEVQCPSPESACLIYPAKGKYQQAFIQPHLELLSRYLEFLRQPNACLVISGFGFNDDHLSEPILSAIKANSSLKLIICDYAAHEQIEGAGSHYWNSLSNSGVDVTFINASFKQLARLIPNLAALNPAEQLGKDVKRLVLGEGW